MFNFEDIIFFSALIIGLFIGPILNTTPLTKKLFPYRGEVLGVIGCIYWFTALLLTGFSDHLGYPSAILAMAASTISSELYADRRNPK
ncbi:hypothetical protein KAR50_05885 [Periweissella fabaria]|uniref:Uncharacterized protein n=1 Tax=Periweissella fabaria TaxID=546157 RepID=A0ABM8Z499_9LACO|nr:hypothetical protein [Periweissella fabaria]MCM0597370.1 hypothetical protein [Periweissella fabaria]CAH0416124.1 hypothetical protein WFA24289_00423 [Periweissella fabaria]